MSDIKFCPNCLKEVVKGTEVCDQCGFQFAPEKEEEASNKVINNEKYDPVPTFLWTVLSFLFPVVGVILFFVFKKEWSVRADACKDGFIIGAIVWTLVIMFLLFFMVDYKEIFKLFGK